jgi:hypothetical protein
MQSVDCQLHTSAKSLAPYSECKIMEPKVTLFMTNCLQIQRQWLYIQSDEITEPKVTNCLPVPSHWLHIQSVEITEQKWLCWWQTANQCQVIDYISRALRSLSQNDSVDDKLLTSAKSLTTFPEHWDHWAKMTLLMTNCLPEPSHWLHVQSVEITEPDVTILMTNCSPVPCHCSIFRALRSPSQKWHYWWQTSYQCQVNDSMSRALRSLSLPSLSRPPKTTADGPITAKEAGLLCHNLFCIF